MKAIQKNWASRMKAPATPKNSSKKSIRRHARRCKKRGPQELGRLRPHVAHGRDYSVTRNYIEWLPFFPWAKTSGGEIEIPKAKEILDADHYDLQKVKDRILDYLSVRRLKPSMKGPILCFVGPPESAKLRSANPFARALGRKFTRLSLGGVHDEAEIRGHRRTYIGALPGQIIQGIRRAETKDPSSCSTKSTK